VPVCFDEDCIFEIRVIVVHGTRALLHFYFCTLKIKKEVRLPTQPVKTKDERSCSSRKKLCFLWVCAVGVLTAPPFAARMLASRPARLWLLPARCHGGTDPTPLPCWVRRKARKPHLSPL